MLAAESFPRKLCWQLLGLWVVFIGGSFAGMLFRFVTGGTGYQPFLALLIVIALLVQLVGLVVAIRLLVREPRYRTWKNIAMTVAGMIPITYLVVVGMTSGFRFHM